MQLFHFHGLRNILAGYVQVASRNNARQRRPVNGPSRLQVCVDPAGDRGSRGKSDAEGGQKTRNFGNGNVPGFDVQVQCGRCRVGIERPGDRQRRLAEHDVRVVDREESVRGGGGQIEIEPDWIPDVDTIESCPVEFQVTNGRKLARLICDLAFTGQRTRSFRQSFAAEKLLQTVNSNLLQTEAPAKGSLRRVVFRHRSAFSLEMYFLRTLARDVRSKVDGKRLPFGVIAERQIDVVIHGARLCFLQIRDGDLPGADGQPVHSERRLIRTSRFSVRIKADRCPRLESSAMTVSSAWKRSGSTPRLILP